MDFNKTRWEGVDTEEDLMSRSLIQKIYKQSCKGTYYTHRHTSSTLKY